MEPNDPPVMPGPRFYPPTRASIGVPFTAAPRRVFSRGVLTVIFWCVGLLVATAAQFKTSFDHETLEVGESTILNVTFEELETKGPPQMPAMTNATVAYVGPSSQYMIVNGRTSSSTTYRYQVTPKQPGEVRLPALSVTVGGKTYTSRPLVLSVAKSSATAGGGGNDEMVGLKMVLPREEVYYGETFPIELRLHTALQIRELNPSTPKMELDGFVISKTAGAQQTQATMNNRAYAILTWRMSATAAKLGELKLGPAQTEAVIQVPTRQNNRRRDPFGMLDEFFGGAELRRVLLSTATNLVRVIPVPIEGKPPEFAGAVGKFNLDVEVSSTNVAVGEPITLRLRVSGEGNVEALSAPQLSQTTGWKFYPPSDQFESNDPLGIQGVKLFEVVIEPESAALKEIPEIRFAFFDPETKKYQTLRHPAIPIRVRASSVAQAAPSRQAVTGEPLAPAGSATDEFRHIKTSLGAVGAIPSTGNLRLWFVLVLAPLPLYALVGAWLTRRERLTNDPIRRRRAQGTKVVEEGMAAMKRAAAANDSKAFFAALGTVLQARIGLALGITAAGITEEILEEKLRPKGMAERDLEVLSALFEAINQARYSPMSSVAELEALRARAESACAALEALEAKS